eukprot:scaffold20351_cov28-Phaeocystis_antarctica.AAC.2
MTPTWSGSCARSRHSKYSHREYSHSKYSHSKYSHCKYSRGKTVSMAMVRVPTVSTPAREAAPQSLGLLTRQLTDSLTY